ncbi:MAG: VPA1262 family N-terminal domain-containing protein [Myxococcota bacterium]|nr:VPA1262 family N-terminal domain-containing protein [Myxococcota bacterium]
MTDEETKQPPDASADALPTLQEPGPPVATAAGQDGWTSVALWCLLLGPDSNDARFLYGWAIPSAAAGEARWIPIRTDSKNSPGGSEFGFLRLVLDAPASSCDRLLMRLAEGEPLADACAAANLPRPQGPVDALGWPAPSDAQQRRRNRDGPPERLPDRFLDTREREGDRHHLLASPVSPNADAPAISASVVIGERLSNAWPADPRGPIAPADRVAIARATLEYLEEETGLAFRGRDAVRVGLLETLRFPSARLNETPRVKMRPGPDKVTIWVEPEGVAVPGRKWLVRCRQRSPAGVVADECQIATEPAEAGRPLSVSFAVPAGGPFSSDVEVWSAHPDASRWSIWFTQQYHPLRQFRGHLMALGTGMQADAGWLAHHQRGRPGKQAAELRTVRRGAFEQRFESGEVPLWWDASSLARETVARMFPPASRARFFPRGFHPQEGLGELSFAKWFHDLTARRDIARMVIVDPYFDQHGVELLGLAAGAGIKYRVLRCSDSRSSCADLAGAPPGDGVEAVTPVTGNPPGEPAHAQRIRDACSAQAHLLRGLDLVIEDLRPSGGQRRAFHDRYILLLDGDDRAVGGFHLSNSLQHAAVNYPLLVTEIPLDVIEEVCQYVDDLFAAKPSIVGSQSLARLYPPAPSMASPQTPSGPTPRERFRRSTSDLAPWPDKAGAEESADLVLAEKHGAKLGRRLAAVSQDQFAAQWTEFAEWLANVPGVHHNLHSIASGDGTDLADRLQHFLESAAQRRLPEGSLGLALSREGLGLSRLCRADFEDCVHDAWEMIEGMVPLIGGPWSLRFGAKMLADLSPAKLVDVIDHVRLAEHNPTDGADLRGAHEALLAILIVTFCEYVETSATSDELASIMQQSGGLVRALAWAAHGRRLVAERIGAEDFERVASALPSRDRVLALAECVWHLRVEANRAERIESASVTVRRNSLFSLIQQAWPSDADRVFLRTVVRHCSGPIDGDWARNAQEDLFAPLVADRKLSADLVAKLWAGMVCDRVQTLAQKQYQFFRPVDAELTVAAAVALAEAPQEVGPVLLRLAPLVKKAKRLAGRPFARSADYDAWSKSVQVLLWCDAFVKLVALCQRSPVPEVASAVADLDLDVGARRSWRAAGLPDPTGLDSFWKQVSQAYADNAACDQDVGLGGNAPPGDCDA